MSRSSIPMIELNEVVYHWQKGQNIRDLELADVPGFTLRFRLDLTPLIEQNRRRSRATPANFVIEEAAKTA